MNRAGRSVLRPPLLAYAVVLLTILVENPVARASQMQLPGTVNFSYSFPPSLEGASGYATIDIPKFNSALGTLTEIDISDVNVFAASAACSAEGGTYVPPYGFFAAWNWAADFDFAYFGDGFSISGTSYQSSYGSGPYPTDMQSASVSVGPITFVPTGATILPSNPYFQEYIGPTGYVASTFYADETTAIEPLPATLGGFTWQGSTIQSAYLDETATTTLVLTYDYTPAVPEPSSALMLVIGATLTVAAVSWSRLGHNVNVARS